MNGVSLPAHVVVILRRVVNTLSTLSLSQVASSHWSSTSQTGKGKGVGYHLRGQEEWECTIAEEESASASGGGTGEKRRGLVKAEAMEVDVGMPAPWTWKDLFAFSLMPDMNFGPGDDMPPPTNDDKNKNNDKEKKKKGLIGLLPFSPPPSPPPNSSNDDLQHLVTSTLSSLPTHPPDTLHQLLLNPALTDPIRTPRYPIVLCHGLYGFDSRGPSTFPSMRMHYWANVLRVLRGRVGAEVIVTSVPGTGSIASRAKALDDQLQRRVGGRGVNFLAHSMGGLDVRHLISRVRPEEYVPLSLTSVCTPHKGSPFMDWCADNLGLGRLEDSSSSSSKEEEEKKEKRRGLAALGGLSDLSLSLLPSSFTTLLLSLVDSPAYANLTTKYLTETFNPNTPDDPRVKYWSVASRVGVGKMGIFHPLWLPKVVVDGVEEGERGKMRNEWMNHLGGVLNEGSGEVERLMEKWRNGEEAIPLWADDRMWGNDGLVSVQSAMWGEFLGTVEGADHWQVRGARGIEFGVDLPAIPAIGLGEVYENVRSSTSSSPSSSASTSSTSTSSSPSFSYSWLTSSIPSIPSIPSISSTNLLPSVSIGSMGDGWGFGELTKMVGVWRTRDADGSGGANDGEGKVGGEGGSVRLCPIRGPCSSTSTSKGVVSSTALTTTTTTTTTALVPMTTPSLTSESTNPNPSSKQMTSTAKSKERLEETAANDDVVVKESTDSLSVVVDWLVGFGGSEREGKGEVIHGKEEKREDGKRMGEKEREVEEMKMVGKRAIDAFVGGGGGSSSSSSPSSPSSLSSTSSSSVAEAIKASEQAKEKQDGKEKEKAELTSKADLERFYVSLARRMYDEGL